MMSSLLYASAAKRKLADFVCSSLPVFLKSCSCSNPYSISSKPLRVPNNTVSVDNLMTAPSIRENSRNASDTSANPSKSAAPMPLLQTDKMLVAFDFDKTLVKVVSEIFVMKLFPDGGKDVTQYEHLPWPAYMKKVFEGLTAAGIKQADVLRCVEQVPFTEGMKDLVKKINDNGHDAIIISNSNSVFIEHILKNAALRSCFSAIFANPSKFDDNGCLQISMYHSQNWCELSDFNICKGHILQEFIKEQKLKRTSYRLVGYVGSGYDDYCPMTRLGVNDIAFPHRGYPVYSAILKEFRLKYKLKSRIIPWESVATINDVLFPRMQNS